MFTMYSNHDVEAFGDAIDAVLKQYEALPVSVMLYSMASTIEREARDFAKLYEARDRSIYEPDLVNTLETCAGILDHTSSRIQCRGETMMHRLCQEREEEIEQLKAALEAATLKIAEMEGQLA